ncbi:hypothetical protein [Blastococcus sp. CT_GayMR16]|uniref:hypothetical protein n=1 Tax=Blastococcus sp. CT_GayMR16 TaxID=2559607 RepID=UPI0010734DE7|nr:hypothetical protein [Blastococcus sp. CT_GayMR16]TFV88491.1 hypothetical protein E4P38_09965 [Blastococcus sp. CT_GayMR16]
MSITARHSRALLATGLAAAALLTACGGDDGTDTSASSSAASSSAEETSAPDLTSGLLPAEAFGPQAAVVAISLEQLQQGTGIAAAGAEGLQITPEACAAAVKGAQPSFDAFDDVAAESATIGTAATVEVLVRGGPIKDAVEQLSAAAERCPQAQITSPQIGQATVTFEALPVDDLGDGAALLRYTTVVSLPDGSQVTIPALIGAVEDGDRLLVMMSLDAGGAAPGAAPATPQDAAAFANLLAQAYDAQAAALD